MKRIQNIIGYISLKHLVAFSFILNVAFYCAVGSWNPDVKKNRILTSDAAGYEVLAENIVHYHTFAGNYDTTQIPLNSPQLQAGHLIVEYDTYREPGYPAFLALVYFITGIKPFIAIFLQLILNILSVVFIYKITLLLFESKNVAILAGLLFAIDIHSIYVANILYSDTLFIFLFLISLYYFIFGIQKKSFLKFIVSAVFMGLACLTRPVVLLYPFILTLVLFLFIKNSWRWVLKTMTVYVLIVYCFVGAWTIRNHIAYGRWQFTTMNGYNLMEFNVAFSESRKSHTSIDMVRAHLESRCDSLGCMKIRNPFDRSNICNRVAWDYIGSHKIDFIETQLWGATHMFLSLGNIDMAQTLGWSSSNVEGQLIMDSQRLQQNFAHKRQALLGILIILLLLVQYAGVLCGFFFLIKTKKYSILIFSISTLLYFTAITGAIGKYRYKLPMEVIICSVSGYGYFSLLNSRNKA